jgi:hypothetical protein
MTTLLRVASRAIRIDKQEIKRFVEKDLVPEIVHALKHFPDDKPLGAKSAFAEASVDVDAVDRGETLVAVVQVNSISSTGKWASVLRGSAGKRVFERGRGRVPVTLSMNGALTPNEYLTPQGQGFSATNRMSPISACTHETCLPYGLYSILIHELTHVADTPFSKGPTYFKDDGTVKDDASYANDPLEVRAFMQNIVDEAAHHAPAMRAHFDNNQKLIDTCLRLSTTWKLIHKDLTPANRAKILKAVYTEFDEQGLLH